MDLRKLKKLIDLVQESGIAELEITEGEEKVRISRGGPAGPHLHGDAAGACRCAGCACCRRGSSRCRRRTGRSAAGRRACREVADGRHLLPRRFARRQDRSSRSGDRVNAGDTLCIIEAMKLLNEIEADQGGVR